VGRVCVRLCMCLCLYLHVHRACFVACFFLIRPLLLLLLSDWVRAAGTERIDRDEDEDGIVKNVLQVCACWGVTVIPIHFPGFAAGSNDEMCTITYL